MPAAGSAVLVGLAVALTGSTHAPAPPVPGSSSLKLVLARVAPARAFFGARDVHIELRFAAAGPLDLQVEIVSQPGGRVVRRFARPLAIPQAPLRVDWNGLTDAGRVAPNGRYEVRIVASGGRRRRVGSLMLHGHIFPVRGPHGVRGPVGEFGAPRSGGRRHQGFDVTAACGTPLVAARAGRVLRRAYDPVLYGNYVIIRGRLTRSDYWYAHLKHPAPVRAGQQVATGQRIGRVGDTGNARTTGCHLHFELRVRGRPIDPEPELRAWDGWS